MARIDRLCFRRGSFRLNHRCGFFFPSVFRRRFDHGEPVLDSVEGGVQLQIQGIVFPDVFFQLRAQTVLVPQIVQIVVPVEGSAEMTVCHVGDLAAVGPFDHDAPSEKQQSHRKDGQQNAPSESSPRLRRIDPTRNGARPDFLLPLVRHFLFITHVTSLSRLSCIPRRGWF